jgi:hypothetical protein
VELFFFYLLRLALSEIGIFSKIVNYFRVIKENSRLTLYLYALTWVGGNIEFNTLYLRIHEDKAFQARIINYIELIILELVNKAATQVFRETSSIYLEEDNNSQ